MLGNIETLITLHEQGTMLKTSSLLRVSQSTVSKRITSLEQYFGKKLVVKSGRRVELTASALKIIEKLGLLIGEVRALVSESEVEQKCRVGVSESILSSWGPKYILPKFTDISFKTVLHCHRSPLVVDKVESGEYDIGICSGKVTTSRALVSDVIKYEEMVLVAKGQFDKTSILSIEKSSSTWRSIAKEISRYGYEKMEYLESFFSIAQISKSTLVTGLIPMGVAKASGFKSKQIRSFKPKIYRPIQVIYKKSKLNQPKFEQLIQSFIENK